MVIAIHVCLHSDFALRSDHAPFVFVFVGGGVADECQCDMAQAARQQRPALTQIQGVQRGEQQQQHKQHKIAHVKRAWRCVTSADGSHSRRQLHPNRLAARGHGLGAALNKEKLSISSLIKATYLIRNVRQAIQ